MTLPCIFSDRKAALVVAHPGHELQVHHWPELAGPTVSVHTDGSGHGDRGRVASSAVADMSAANSPRGIRAAPGKPFVVQGR